MENDIKHSENFIKEKMGKKHFFSVPDDYLDTIEFDILSKISEKKLDKTNAFEVPKDYFNNLEEKLLTNVNSDEKQMNVFSLKKRLLRFIPYATAASIALFIGLNTFNSDKKVTFDAISDSEIEYWMDQSTISTNEVATLLEDEILNETAFSFADIKEENIEDYINSTDNTSILSELY